MARKVTYSRMTEVGDARAKIPPLSGTKKKTPTMAQVVIVSPGSDEKADAEQLKNKIMSLIDPCRDKIRIKGVMKRGDGKVSVEMATEEDLRKIVENDKLNTEGLVAIRSGALNPKVVVYDVPRQIKQDKLARFTRLQNEMLLGEFDKKMTEEQKGKEVQEFAKEFIPRFRIGTKDGPLSSWVVEVSPKIKNILRSNEANRLFLQWQSCKIQDYRGVTRCYNCQTYGHVAKFCAQKEKTCSFCAGIAHSCGLSK